MYGSLDPECKYSPWACKAVFSSLSALSKNYVQRLLAIEEPLSSSSLEKWVKPEHKHTHQKTIDDLIRLWVLVVHKSSDEEEEEEAEEEETNDKTTKLLILNPYFRKGLQHALCHPEEPWSTSAVAVGLKPDKKAPSLDFLDDICAEKWNYVLRHLLNILPKGTSPDLTIENFMLQSQMLTRSGNKSGGNEMTAKGYEFMLKDHRSQVWIYVMVALDRSTQQEEGLSFLFMLADCELGKGYPIDALTKSQRQLMFEFSKIGLIYIRDLTASRFYPTRAAIDMLFQTTRDQGKQLVESTVRDGTGMNGTGIVSNPVSKLQIIVEGNPIHIIVVFFVTPPNLNHHLRRFYPTLISIHCFTTCIYIFPPGNLQVIAYLSTDLHRAMLEMFVEVHVMMPNMAIGRITRERSKYAYNQGINASQIIDYLTNHAHPVTLTRTSIIPQNVSDQLLLWEAENYRVQTEDAAIVELGHMIIHLLFLYCFLILHLSYQSINLSPFTHLLIIVRSHTWYEPDDFP